MSDKGPKNKNTDSKIKFFKIDPEGEIAPAFPKDGEPLDEPSNPHFSHELTSSIPNINISIPDSEEGPRNEALGELKPEVENISSLPDNANLSQNQSEVLRKYIALKESEVRDLQDQHRQYETFLKKVSSSQLVQASLLPCSQVIRSAT